MAHFQTKSSILGYSSNQKQAFFPQFSTFALFILLSTTFKVFKMNKLVILFLVFAFLGSIEAYRKVAIETIPYLDLYRNRYTIGNNPVLQQVCVEDGARLCTNYRPDYVHCINTGQRNGQVIWQCQARLSNGVRLGSLNVSNVFGRNVLFFLRT